MELLTRVSTDFCRFRIWLACLLALLVTVAWLFPVKVHVPRVARSNWSTTLAPVATSTRRSSPKSSSQTGLPFEPCLRTDRAHLGMKAPCSSYPIVPSTFLYLVMGVGYPRPEWLARSQWANVTLLYLAWRDDIRSEVENLTSHYDDVHVFYYPNSTWTTGRNYQLQKAYDLEMRQRWKFEFYLFFDEDVSLSYRRIEDPGKVITCSTDSDQGFRLLTRNLLRDRPLRAGVSYVNHYDWTSKNIHCIRQCHIDNMIVAVHRTAVDLLLPYSPKFDANNWWMSAHMANIMSEVLATEHCATYRDIINNDAQNLHSKYPRNAPGKYSKETRDFVDSCLLSKRYAVRNVPTCRALPCRNSPEGPRCMEHPLGVNYEEVLRDRLTNWPVTCV